VEIIDRENFEMDRRTFRRDRGRVGNGPEQDDDCDNDYGENAECDKDLQPRG